MVISYGIKQHTTLLTGKRMWQPDVIANGNITAHEEVSIRQANGTSTVEQTIIPAMMINAMVSATQNRLKIFGTSLKKLERSTSFFVAAQVMLYENICARIA